MATLSLFAPDAEDRLGALRAGPCPATARCAPRPLAGTGASWRASWRHEAWPLRRAVARAVETIAQGPLPRVWQNLNRKRTRMNLSPR